MWLWVVFFKCMFHKRRCLCEHSFFSAWASWIVCILFTVSGFTLFSANGSQQHCLGISLKCVHWFYFAAVVLLECIVNASSSVYNMLCLFNIKTLEIFYLFKLFFNKYLFPCTPTVQRALEMQNWNETPAALAFGSHLPLFTWPGLPHPSS